MSFPSLSATPPAPASASTPWHGGQLNRELTDLVDEIQRTRDWFNAQIEAQINSLNQLRATMQGVKTLEKNPMAALFAAAPPVATAVVVPEPEKPVAPAPPARPTHQAIVLPPTYITAIDPDLEQTTLHELNEALTRAFSEISSRSGMPG